MKKGQRHLRGGKHALRGGKREDDRRGKNEDEPAVPERKLTPAQRRAQEKQQERKERKNALKERRKKQYSRADDKDWQPQFDKFQLQMKLLGLSIVDVAGDGNCLFRALGDQLFGDPGRHAEVMDFIEMNRESFEPFIEDDEPFEKYVKGMRKNGSWGGNLEVQAASLAYGVNILIYQLGQPRWDVVNFPALLTRHRYHDGQHYNSVQRLNDRFPSVFLSNGERNPARVDIPELLPGAVPAVAAAAAAATHTKAEAETLSSKEKQIMAATGCRDLNVLRELLQENEGDVEATIQALLFIAQTDPTSIFCDEAHSDVFIPEECLTEPVFSPTPNLSPASSQEEQKSETKKEEKPGKEHKEEKEQKKKETASEKLQRKFGTKPMSNRARKEEQRLKKEEEKKERRRERAKQREGTATSPEGDQTAEIEGIPLEAFQTVRI